MRNMLGAAHILTACTERLGQLDSIEYIERLERQKSALSLANEVKKKRIVELEAKVVQCEVQIQQCVFSSLVPPD